MITLYFDETNNHRAVSIANGKLNIPDDDKDFVLGGIGINDKIDLEKLKKDLTNSIGFSPENLPEDIKLKTIANGDFLDCLKSQKLKQLISALKENKILIHYFRTNIAFWNTLDIIESLLMERKLSNELIISSIKAKEELLNLYKSKKKEFIEIFERFNYPDIKASEVKSFYREIYSLCIDAKGVKNLKIFLKIGSKSETAIFIQDNKPLKLIEDFANNYIFCIEMHKKYKLILDNEKSIQDKVQEYFAYTKQNIDYTFIKKDFFLQISDIIVGLLGKLYDYTNKKDLPEIKKDLCLLNEHQLRILSDLKEIMEYTQNIDPKLGFETAPITSVEKQVYIIKFKK